MQGRYQVVTDGYSDGGLDEKKSYYYLKDAKPLAERFQEAANRITDEELDYIIKSKIIKNRLRNRLISVLLEQQ